MFEVIHVEAKRKKTAPEPGRRDECECVFFNETDQPIRVNSLTFVWDNHPILLLSEQEVGAYEAVRCDASFYYHAHQTPKTYWRLDVESDGDRYSNEWLKLDLWEQDGGQIVTARLYKMGLVVDPPCSSAATAPMKRR